MTSNNENLNMKYYQYNNPDSYNVKTVNITEDEASKEYERFKEKIQKITETSKSYNDAKDTVKKTFKVNNGTSYLRVGDAYCTITITPKLVSIILNSKKELISYCFNMVTKEKKQSNKEKLS